MDQNGRLLTIALNIEYSGVGDDVGIIRCHTAWQSTAAEMEVFYGG